MAQHSILLAKTEEERLKTLYQSKCNEVSTKSLSFSPNAEREEMLFMTLKPLFITFRQIITIRFTFLDRIHGL